MNAIWQNAPPVRAVVSPVSPTASSRAPSSSHNLSKSLPGQLTADGWAILLHILCDGACGVGHLLQQAGWVLGAACTALAQLSIKHRQTLLWPLVRLPGVLQSLTARLWQSRVGRAVLAGLGALVCLRLHAGRGSGEEGLVAHISSSFSFLFGLLRVSSNIRITVGGPISPTMIPEQTPRVHTPSPTGHPTHATSPVHGVPGPCTYDASSVPGLGPDACVGVPECEELRVLCAPAVKEHIMRFLESHASDDPASTPAFHIYSPRAMSEMGCSTATCVRESLPRMPTLASFAAAQQPAVGSGAAGASSPAREADQSPSQTSPTRSMRVSCGTAATSAAAGAAGTSGNGDGSGSGLLPGGVRSLTSQGTSSSSSRQHLLRPASAESIPQDARGTPHASPYTSPTAHRYRHAADTAATHPAAHHHYRSSWHLVPSPVASPGGTAVPSKHSKDFAMAMYAAPVLGPSSLSSAAQAWPLVASYSACQPLEGGAEAQRNCAGGADDGVGKEGSGRVGTGVATSMATSTSHHSAIEGVDAVEGTSEDAGSAGVMYNAVLAGVGRGEGVVHGWMQQAASRPVMRYGGGPVTHGVRPMSARRALQAEAAQPGDVDA